MTDNPKLGQQLRQAQYMAELRAENMRLKQRFDKRTQVAERAYNELHTLRAENETLKQALAFAEGEVKGLADERLQRENRELRAEARVALADADAAGMALVRESERLRALLDHAEEVNGELTAENERLKEANASLQQSVENLRSLLASQR